MTTRITVLLGRCRWCGVQLTQSLKGRNRVYCSPDCRKKYQKECKRDE